MASRYFGAIILNVVGLELRIADLKTGKTLEHVQKNLQLSDDIYNQNVLSVDSVNQIVDGLRGFVQLLHDYRIKDFQLWSSQAISNVKNADFVADQLYMHTGLSIEWLSLSQETFFRVQEVLHRASQNKKKLKGITYIISITSGDTMIVKLDDGKFTANQSFSLGPAKIAEDLESLFQEAPNSTGVLNDYIASKLNDFNRSTNQKPSNVILVGTLPLKNLITHGNDDSKELVFKEFEELQDSLINASGQFLAEHYGIESQYLPLVLPEILLLKHLLTLTNAQKINLSNASMLDGLVLNRAVQHGFLKRDFSKQTIKQAENLARHYRIEPKHQQLVTDFALHLFDQLKTMHQMGKRERLLLKVAAILHDCGNYIGGHDHYIHSEYIIRNSDIFGLSKLETEIVALVSRYHSVQTPGNDYSSFTQMPVAQRIIVAKLAAILRLADALDDDRQQKIKDIIVSLKPKKVIITAKSNERLSFENWVFKTKSQFFTETFGLKVTLKQRRIQANGK